MEAGGRTDGLIRLMYWFLSHSKVTIVNGKILESKMEMIYGLWQCKGNRFYILYYTLSPHKNYVHNSTYQLCCVKDLEPLVVCIELW